MRRGNSIDSRPRVIKRRSLRYPERCSAPLEAATSPDFVAHAAELRYNLEGNLVSGLFVYDKGHWRGRARSSEQVVSGMAMLIEHRPIAAWQLELVAGDPQRSRTLSLAELERADQRLIVPPPGARAGGGEAGRRGPHGRQPGLRLVTTSADPQRSEKSAGPPTVA